MKSTWRATLLLLLVLAGCGGGSGTNLADSGGMSGTGITRGSVTGFGSIYVLGTEYATDSALVTIDGEQVPEDAFRVGMPVTVYGSDGSRATAERVVFDPVVTGPVTAVDAADFSLTVMGVRISLNGSTLLSGVDLGDVEVGDVLQVAGAPATEGVIRAEYVRRLAVAGARYRGRLEIEGYVDGLDAGARELSIGGLTVDYSRLTVMDSFTPSVGDLVAGSVHADGDAGLDRSGGRARLQVERLERKERGLDFTGANDRHVRLEGWAERVGNGNAPVILVAGQRVRLPPGSPRPETGDWITVEGVFHGGKPGTGIVQVDEATDFVHRGPAEIEIRDRIDSLSRQGGDTRLHTRLGVTVRITGATVLLDENEDTLALEQLDGDEKLAIVAARQSGTLVATRVTRLDETGGCALTGRLQAGDWDQHFMELLGVTVRYEDGVVDGTLAAERLVNVSTDEPKCHAPDELGERVELIAEKTESREVDYGD